MLLFPLRKECLLISYVFFVIIWQEVRTSRRSLVCPQKFAFSSHQATLRMERSTREICLNFTVVLITVILIWLLVRSYQYWDATTPGIDCNAPGLSSVCPDIPLLSWDAFSGTPWHFWPVRTISGVPPELLSMASKCLPVSIRFIPQFLLQMC